MKEILRITKGKNAQTISALGKLDTSKDWKITIEEWSCSRTISQNKMYWDLLTEIGKYLGYSSEEMHSLMAYKYLSYKSNVMDKEITVIPSTTKLNVKEFSNYISQVKSFASELGFKNNTNTHSGTFQNFQDA